MVVEVASDLCEASAMMPPVLRLRQSNFFSLCENHCNGILVAFLRLPHALTLGFCLE
jgi:hypothetical protein